MALPLEHNPNYLHDWSNTLKMGSLELYATPCCPKSQASRHAILSMTTIWGGPTSTNPYSKLLNAYPHLCCTFETIPSTTTNYATPPFWVSKVIMLPCHSWSLRFIAVWNTAARIRPIESNPTWLTVKTPGPNISLRPPSSRTTTSVTIFQELSSSQPPCHFLRMVDVQKENAGHIMDVSGVAFHA
eukprot:1160524-Pelagomonas_calceolata.AAC.2